MAASGRKTTPSPEKVDDGTDPKALTDAARRADEATAIIESLGADRDLAHVLLGQIEMAQAFGKLANVASLAKLEQIKQQKLYRALAGKTVPASSLETGHGAQFSAALPGASGQETGNGAQFSNETVVLNGTWEEYCRLLGMSRDMVDRDLLNLHAFGEDALKGLTRAGVGYREMRQLRKLPDDDRQQLIALAKTEDKSALLDLVEDLVGRNEQLKAAVADRDLTIDAKDKVTAKTVERNRVLEERLARPFVPTEKSAARTASERAMLDELNFVTTALEPVLPRLTEVCDDVFNTATSKSVQLRARQEIVYLAQFFAELLYTHNISIDPAELSQRPNYMREIDEALAAQGTSIKQIVDEREAKKDAAQWDRPAGKGKGKGKAAG